MGRKMPEGVYERTWEETLYALRTTHTYSIKTLCKGLKCSRAWVNDFILENVNNEERINLASGHLSNGFGYSWVQRAKRNLAAVGYTLPENSQIWLNASYVDNLLLSNSKATQQTKLIPKRLLLKDPQDYMINYRHIMDRIEKAEDAEDVKECRRLKKNLKSLDENGLTNLGRTIVEEGHCSPLKRGEVTQLVELPELPNILLPNGLINFHMLKAPHNEKDYGDTDEAIYRDFFSSGEIKITIELKGKDEQIGQKVFYVQDPDKPPYDELGGTVLIKATVWEQYKDYSKIRKKQE